MWSARWAAQSLSLRLLEFVVGVWESRLGRQVPGCWSMTLVPEAGEGGGSFQPSRRVSRAFVAAGQGADPDRSRAVASSRAARVLRQYCAANRLNRFGSLTYAGQGVHDPVVVRRDAGEFFRALRRELGGRAFPYAWVPEWHPGGHGLHLHFAVSRFVHRSKIQAAWGRGIFDIRLISGLPVGSSVWDESRVAARYMAKYVSKSFDDGAHPAGLHRYEVAEGFQPGRERLAGSSVDEVVSLARERMGRYRAGCGTPPRLRAGRGLRRSGSRGEPRAGRCAGGDEHCRAGPAGQGRRPWGDPTGGDAAGRAGGHGQGAPAQRAPGRGRRRA